MDKISPLSQLISKYVLVTTEREICKRDSDFDGKLDRIGIKIPSSPQSLRFL